MQISLPHVLICIAYLAILVVVGLVVSRRVKTTTDYWVGGRQLGPFAVALSFCAAYYSTTAVVSAAPQYYMYGLGYSSIENLSNTLITGLIIFIPFALKMRAVSERAGAVSFSGYLAVRYRSNTIRLISAILVAVFLVPYGVAVMTGIASALTTIIGFPYIPCILIIAVVALIYIITSGYWGAAITNVIQGITITLSVVLVAAFTIKACGGLTPIIQNLSENHPEHLQIPGPLSWGQMFSYAMIWPMIAFGQPQLVSNFMGLKDTRTMGTVVRVSIIWIAVFMYAIAIMGVGALYLFEGQEFFSVDTITSTLALRGGTVISGIFLCGCLAAGLSTLVAIVLTASAAISKDILEDYRSAKTGKPVDNTKSMRNSRIVTAIVFVVITILSLKPWDIVWALSAMSGGIHAACFTGVLLVGMYWRKATKAGALASIIGGFVVSYGWYLLGLERIILCYVPGIIASILLLVVVSKFTKPLPEEHVDLFFKKKYKRKTLEDAIKAVN